MHIAPYGSYCLVDPRSCQLMAFETRYKTASQKSHKLIRGQGKQQTARERSRCPLVVLPQSDMCSVCGDFPVGSFFGPTKPGENAFADVCHPPTKRSPRGRRGKFPSFLWEQKRSNGEFPVNGAHFQQDFCQAAGRGSNTIFGPIRWKTWKWHVTLAPLTVANLNVQYNAAQRFKTELRILHAILRPLTFPSTSRNQPRWPNAHVGAVSIFWPTPSEEGTDEHAQYHSHNAAKRNPRRSRNLYQLEWNEGAAKEGSCRGRRGPRGVSSPRPIGGK